MSDFKQIASNPELLNWYHRETKVDHQYKTVVIEQAFDWEYVYIPGLEHSKGEHPDHLDYNRIPQSLHYDDGMKITWGWMIFQTGYQQSIPVKNGQRYTAVAKFTGDIRDTQDNNAIQWQFFIDGLQSCHSDWSTYSHPNQFNHPTEHQFVFQANADGWVDLTFWTKAAWADSSGELRIQSLEVFEVPGDYGMALPVTPFPNDDQHPGDDTPDTEPTLPTAPPWLLYLVLLVGGILIAVIVYSLLAPRLNASVVEVTQMDFMSLDQAGVMIITTIVSIVAGLTTSPIVVNLTSLIKRLPFMQSVRAEFIAYPLAGLIGAGYWIFQIIGQDAQYVSYMDILNVAIGAAVTILGSLFSGTVIYNMAVKRGVSVIGHKRS
jgi:hypothetical protein